MLILIAVWLLALASTAEAHSTQACLNSSAVASKVSVAVADCEAKATAALDAKDAEIARLQAELQAIKLALPCQRIVYNPDDLQLAQQQPGPVCVVVDTVKTCTAEFCDGYWTAEPTKRGLPVQVPKPKAPPKAKPAPRKP